MLYSDSSVGAGTSSLLLLRALNSATGEPNQLT